MATKLKKLGKKSEDDKTSQLQKENDDLLQALRLQEERHSMRDPQVFRYQLLTSLNFLVVRLGGLSLPLLCSLANSGSSNSKEEPEEELEDEDDDEDEDDEDFDDDEED